jgi:hypothetical protein
MTTSPATAQPAVPYPPALTEGERWCSAQNLTMLDKGRFSVCAEMQSERRTSIRPRRRRGTRRRGTGTQCSRSTAASGAQTWADGQRTQRPRRSGDSLWILSVVDVAADRGLELVEQGLGQAEYATFGLDVGRGHAGVVRGIAHGDGISIRGV